MDKADCACVSEAVVLAEEEREAVSLRIRAARLASSRLPGSLKLFDDRTGQHHRRWGEWGGSEGGGCWWGMEACHLYTAVSFILSTSPSSSYAPSSSSISSSTPLLLYSSVAVASLRLRDPFKLFKEVVRYSQAPRPAARRARVNCRKRK